MNGAQNTGLDITTLVVAILTFIGLLANLAWSYYSFRQQRNDSVQQRKEAAENAEQLNNIRKEVEQSTRLHDQKVQRLYRAREAVITIHKKLAYMYFLDFTDRKIAPETAAITRAELMAAVSELKGIAIALEDAEFIKQINDGFASLTTSGKKEDLAKDELKINTMTEQLHIHITKLLEQATKT